MEVSGHPHAPAASSPVKEPPIPTGYKAGWAQEPVWIRWRRNRKTLPCPCRGSNSHCPAYRL